MEDFHIFVKLINTFYLYNKTDSILKKYYFFYYINFLFGFNPQQQGVRPKE